MFTNFPKSAPQGSNAKKNLFSVVEKMSFESEGLFGSGRPKGLSDPKDPLERQLFFFKYKNWPKNDVFVL